MQNYRIMNHPLLSVFFLFITLVACRPGTPEGSACTYGEPQPIFHDGMTGIVDHEFERQGQESAEHLTLEEGKTVRVLQSGCDQLRQTFQIDLPPAVTDTLSTGWPRLAAQELRNLARRSPDLLALNSWATAIVAQEAEIKIVQPHELEPGFLVVIDRITGAQSTTLIITFSTP